MATPKVLIDVVYRAMHAHGSLGVTSEMPLMSMWQNGPVMGIADGPTEVHKDTIAKTVLKGYHPYEGLFPSQHIPTRTQENPRPYRGQDRERDRQPVTGYAVEKIPG